MKKLVASITLCALLFGCTGGINDQLIINGAAVAVSTGLKTVKNSETRHTIANLLQGYAPGLRAITNNPTAEQLAHLVDEYTPADIKTKYPEAVAFATPLLINAVLTAVKTFGASKPWQITNDVATGLEIGSAGQ